ncbi:unnamed protein product [Calicophoron daubneyi]|uniref:Glutathione S-transferase n=1 Tax=Calicophoron daubneyi TaxID=300641 RepID=A0AAV2T9L2_CALDB
MPGDKFKLTYFNTPGLGEPIRYLLHALDIPFEDHRIEFSEWPNLKPKIPTHQVPYLEVTDSSDKTVGYSESLAIARCIARKHHMMGQTDDEYYRIERIIGQCMDLNRSYFDIYHYPDEEEKILHEFKTEKGPRLLEAVCNSLKESGGKFVAGDKPSFGDIFMLYTMEHVKLMAPELIKCPSFTAHREAVLEAYPKLAEYTKTHAFTYPPMPK